MAEIGEEYFDVNFLVALGKYGEALQKLSAVLEETNEVLPYADLYPSTVGMRFEGEFVGEFRFWDDFWWWHPVQSPELTIKPV